MDVELEHGLHDQLTNVTQDDPLITGKIALAHLNEFPDYYTRLAADGGGSTRPFRLKQGTLLLCSNSARRLTSITPRALSRRVPMTAFVEAPAARG